MTVEYTIVITGDNPNYPLEQRECQELMKKFAAFINDYTIYEAKCFVHDTSLPATEEQSATLKAAYTGLERRHRHDTVVFNRRSRK